MPQALLINPWIYDFAAFDMWAFPLGLLSLSALLKRAGWEVSYIDCTDRHHPSIAGKVPREKIYHQGKYYSEIVEKPSVLSFVPRRYRRYGIPEEAFKNDLSREKRPDAILVTSRMTYWYPGVKRAVEIVREALPGIPVLLGGIYATLCSDHAGKTCKPDFLLKGEGEISLFHILHETTGIAPPTGDSLPGSNPALDALPIPDYGILSSKKALALETSRGCPYNCTYCASRVLIPRFRRKSAGRVADEIEYAVETFGTGDFAFYDDALLYESPEHFEKIAGEVSGRKIGARFHTPNSVFASEISPLVAENMRAMGFQTIRISLETTNLERLKKMNRKILPGHFDEAMKNLHKAGFTEREIGVYIMAGLPGQGAQEVRDAIDYVIDRGAIPHIAEYSPIPGTAEWRRAVESTDRDISSEPLFHNNTVYHLIGGDLGPTALEELKHYTWDRATRS